MTERVVLETISEIKLKKGGRIKLFPLIILPSAFASLIQNIFMVSQFSDAGLVIFVGVLIGWHLFVNKTNRGKMVFDSWTQKVPNEEL